MSNLKLLIVSLCAALCSIVSAVGQPRVLTLDEIFALADQNSKTIASSQTALLEAEESIRETRTCRLPDIDLSLSASYLGNGTLTDRDFTNAMGVEMPHFGNNFAVEAAQLIYGGGAVNNAIALAELKRDMASVDLDATRSRVRFMLAGYYLDLYKFRNILRVFDENIALAKELLDEISAKEKEGLAIKNDITRFELRLKNLELQRTRVLNNISILNADLVTVLGLEPECEIIPDEKLLSQTLRIDNEEYWQQLAQEQAHPLKQGELAIKMSQRNEKLARSERLPKVALVAANHFDGPITIEVPTIDKNFNYWYVGLGVNFRLSSLYKASRTLKRAKISTTLAQQRYDEVLEQTTLSTKSDYIKYVESYREIETLEKSLELAQSNYSVIQTRYRNDIALTTDMLDAANQRLDAELKLENGQVNVIFNYYKLKCTTGNL